MSADPVEVETIVHNSQASAARGDEPAAAGEPGPPRLTWRLRALLVGLLAIPALLLALAAWENLRVVERQAEEKVVIEASELAAHDLSAFEIYLNALGWISARVDARHWDAIAGDPDLRQLLANIGTLPQVDAVWLVDSTGQVRASSRFFPANAAMSGDDAFAAQQGRGAGMFIGRVHRDPLTHDRVFDISRSLTLPNGRFAGAVLLSARPEYFQNFYANVSDRKKYYACLIRADGAVLAGFPPANELPPTAPALPFLRAVAAATDGSAFRAMSPIDGVERIFARYRLSGLPLDVVFGVPERDPLSAWRANLRDYTLFAVPAALALCAMTWIAVRQIGRERVASWRWQTTARRLQREIDHRTRAEAELRQVQKIEALGQLTGGVAHDFNNLLAVMQGCLEMLSGRQADERLQKRVDLALETVGRGTRLVRQLLAFARDRPAAVVGLDLNAELRGMSELLTRTVGAGVKIVTELAPDLCPIDADPTRIELVVVNLIVNACDAMPNGGMLLIRTANRRFPATSKGGWGTVPEGVELEIADTGTGMSPEVAARAFEPFFTTKAAGRGTGLGLSMADELVRQAGGSATIRTVVGRGTSVTLQFPASRAANPAAQDLPATGRA